MFRVLTSRKKSRLLSSRFVVLSIGAHLVVAAAAVNAAARPAPPPPQEDPPILFDIDDKPKAPSTPPPPAPVYRATRPQAQHGTPPLQPPATVPSTIVPEAQNTGPVTPDAGTGPIGDPTAPPSTDSVRGPVGPPSDGEPYVAEAVEVQPSLANAAEVGRLLTRNYPPILADAGVAGRTIVEVIIEPNGRVRPGSARIVETTHEQFGDATLRMVERLRFRPAKVNEQPVAVIAQIPIDWQAPRN
jgi:periplasmic protein TonB